MKPVATIKAPRPRCRSRRLQALPLAGLLAGLLAAAGPACAVLVAGIDPEEVFPEREGWQELHVARDWTRPRIASGAPRVAAVPLPETGSTASEGSGVSTTADSRAGSTDGSGTSATPDRSAVSTDGTAANLESRDSGNSPAGGVVAVVGSGYAIPEDAPPALAGVRYRILERGDERPPTARGDGGSAWLRASARDLNGNAYGSLQRPVDEDENHVRRIDWNDMPAALALAVHQMPYHARWEVFVPAGARPAASSGSYRVFRPRPLVYDVERLPPQDMPESLAGLPEPTVHP